MISKLYFTENISNEIWTRKAYTPFRCGFISTIRQTKNVVHSVNKAFDTIKDYQLIIIRINSFETWFMII